MNFEQANEIMNRKYSWLLENPTDEEYDEAEKAFGIDGGELCPICSRRDVCEMHYSYTTHCNFYVKE